MKDRVGGLRGCTHLTELLNAMANTAMQTMFALRREIMQALPDQSPPPRVARPWVVDTCHAYRMEGEAVAVVWPPERRAVASS